MAITKTQTFSEQSIEMARIAKALGHPARIEILKLLLERQACICGTIVDAIPLSQATVSQHLKELKKAGLIKGTIDGPRVCYCIDEEVWERASLAISAFFRAAQNDGGCC